jgi:dTDP-4-amino-4,6-dideoxygalactose transaminase
MVINKKQKGKSKSVRAILLIVLFSFVFVLNSIFYTLSFAASGLPVVWNNLTPVFVDIDPDSFTIDVNKIEALITKKTSAIFATHVFGVPCNVVALKKLAKKHNLKLIFDAAHAFGSEHNSKKVGQFGDVEVFSLSPTKVLTAGEGGLVTTNDKKLAEYVRQGRNYGDDGFSTVPHAGLSARMSELHAAAGVVSLKSLNKNLKRRISQAEYFKKGLMKIEPRLQFQKIPDSIKTNYKDLSVRIRPDVLGYTREDLQAYFTSKGVMTRSYFHPALHTFATYAPHKKPNVPVTDIVSAEALSLPLYSHITKDDIDYVLRAFKEFTHDRKKP